MAWLMHIATDVRSTLRGEGRLTRFAWDRMRQGLLVHLCAIRFLVFAKRGRCVWLSPRIGCTGGLFGGHADTRGIVGACARSEICRVAEFETVDWR